MESPLDRSSLLDRIVHGRLVGREHELSVALAQLRRAVTGEGNVLLISGEPGIGKTRFMREVTRQAESLGAVTLLSECYAEGGAPYAPIVQLLRQAFEHPVYTLLTLPEAVVADLAPLLPPSNSRVLASPPRPRLDPQSEQMRLFESVATWSQTLSAQAPLLLSVDDVHWADFATLYLLRHLARRGRHLRLLIVLSFRTADTVPSPGLTEVLIDLNRERLATPLDLARLSRTETSDLLAYMFAEEPTPEFSDSLYRQTEGNPFFLEEVCKGLINQGKIYYRDDHWHHPNLSEIKIPLTVRSAILARVLQLPEKVQDVLRMAAILGTEFEFELLKQTLDMDEEAVIAALEEAVRAHVISEVHHVKSARFAFAHVLIPTALRESIIQVRRQRLHHRAAATIEAFRPDDFETLAYHYGEAGDLDRARNYYFNAGVRSQGSAPQEAAESYRAALERWPADDRAGRADLFAKLGYCLWTMDDVPTALQNYHEAFKLFDQLGYRTQSGEAQRMLGRLYWEQANRAAAEEHFQQALVILEHGPETIELARAMSSISQMHLLAPEEDKAITWAQRALALANRLSAEDVIADALNNIGSGLAQTGEYEAGLAKLQESLQRALEIGLPTAACRAAYNMTIMLHRQCRYARALAQAEQLYAYANQVYHRGYANLALLRLTMENWLIGRWSDALAHRSQMVEFSGTMNSTWSRRILGSIDLDLGRITEALDELEKAEASASRADDLQTTVPHLGQLLRAYHVLGKQAQAAETAHRLLRFVGRTAYVSAESIMPLLFACHWFASHPTHDFPANANDGLAHLERHATQYHSEESQAALAESHGYVLLAQQRLVDAADQFNRAVALWESIERRYDQARVLSGLGQVLAKTGDAPAARTALDQAFGIFNALAAQLAEPTRATFLESPLVRETRGLAQELSPNPVQHPIAKQSRGVLTAREREVAVLVAQGKSNHGIADEMVLSQRTVENHIANIMSKLGFNSRTQIAVWAVENGLAKARNG